MDSDTRPLMASAPPLPTAPSAQEQKSPPAYTQQAPPQYTAPQSQHYQVQPQYAQQQQPYAPGTVQQYGQTQYTDPYGARHAYGTNGAVATVTTTSSFGGGLYYNGWNNRRKVWVIAAFVFIMIAISAVVSVWMHFVGSTSHNSFCHTAFTEELCENSFWDCKWKNGTGTHEGSCVHA